MVSPGGEGRYVRRYQAGSGSCNNGPVLTASTNLNPSTIVPVSGGLDPYFVTETWGPQKDRVCWNRNDGISADHCRGRGPGALRIDVWYRVSDPDVRNFCCRNGHIITQRGNKVRLTARGMPANLPKKQFLADFEAKCPESVPDIPTPRE
jgi:hypothetical protein